MRLASNAPRAQNPAGPVCLSRKVCSLGVLPLAPAARKLNTSMRACVARIVSPLCNSQSLETGPFCSVFVLEERWLRRPRHGASLHLRSALVAQPRAGQAAACAARGAPVAWLVQRRPSGWGRPRRPLSCLRHCIQQDTRRASPVQRNSLVEPASFSFVICRRGAGLRRRARVLPLPAWNACFVHSVTKTL